MNLDKSNDIIRLVDGDELNDGLSTIALALIHKCTHHGFSKDEMLAGIGRLWDLYQRQILEHHAQKEKLN